MLVNIVLATLGAVGVAFYLRFLVALSKESKRSRIGYWLRLRLGTHEKIVTEIESDEEPLVKAA